MHGTRRFPDVPLDYLDVVRDPVQQTVMIILAVDYRIYDLPEMHLIALCQPWQISRCTDHSEPTLHWLHILCL
jgi:hypothetical protein